MLASRQFSGRENSGKPCLLSWLSFYNRLFAPAHLVQDDVGGGLPLEGLGFVVPVRQPSIHRLLQFTGTMEGSAADHAVGDEAEKSFHLIEPGAAGRGEVEMKTLPFFRLQPSLYVSTLVRACNADHCQSRRLHTRAMLHFFPFWRFTSPVAERECTDQLVAIPPLRLHGLTRGNPGRFASALLSFPPFHESATGPLVSHIPRARLVQRNKSPLSVFHRGPS